MIVSVSRRTDIPAWYADWFFGRLRAGYADVRNPYRPQKVSRVMLTPETVDGFVFWTKNPLPMLERLEELQDRAYYFQFTLTPYGRKLEPALPHKREVLLPAFRRLAELAGPQRVVWRYDPVVLTEQMTLDAHQCCFREMAQRLEGATDECIVSFVDDYACARRRMKQAGMVAPNTEEAASLLSFFAETAREYGMRLSVCCEPSLLEGRPISGNITPARCIDSERLSKIADRPLCIPPDNNQRKGCGCAKSVDIGAYDTCRTGCVYCYASHSIKRLAERCAQHDPASSLLYGENQINL